MRFYSADEFFHQRPAARTRGRFEENEAVETGGTPRTSKFQISRTQRIFWEKEGQESPLHS